MKAIHDSRFSYFVFHLFVLGSVAVLAPAQSAAGRQPVTLPHLQAAFELLSSVAPSDTSYQHKGGAVVWPGEAGAARAECHTDCSGFIDALLKRAYGLDDAQLKEWISTKRPLARHYHAAIAEGRGFQAIPTLDQVRPGDLLAIQYPEGSKNTGHMLLVADVPRLREPSAPLVAGTRQWEVTVIDVSESGHGTTDSRHHEDHTSGEGLGRGVLRIYTDASGAVAGYSWSTLKASNFEDQASHHMLIGRLQPAFLQTLKKAG